MFTTGFLRNMRKFIAITCLICLIGCQKKVQPKLKKGIYRAELKVNDSSVLPFNFKVISDKSMEIYNAEEIIHLNKVIYKKDSVFIYPPVFEGYLAAKFNGDTLKGKYITPNLNRLVSFEAVWGEKERFDVLEKSKTDISGNWETIFSPNDYEEKYLAQGVFKQSGQKVTGTFRTTTGDYRFLEGVIDGNKLKLSTFDGAHAYLFTATVTDSTMTGTFYSGSHFKEPFVAKRNEEFELPNADSLTFLNPGYDKVSFSFPDVMGNLISLEDDRFKNKVVIVQLMGSWCPNCLDESRFFSKYYNENKDKPVEVVALAFEYVKTQEKAIGNLERLKEDVGITYPVLLAQYGTSSKEQAQEKLPMLNKVLSYPTSIFIDKQGKVRKIHTGFDGPATGEKYIEFVEDFNIFVNELIAE